MTTFDLRFLLLPFLAAMLSCAQNRPPNALVMALDTDGDGVISAAEMRDSTASLRKLDRNGDGQLTANEFRPGFGGRVRGGPGGRGNSDELVATLMAFDKNGDGKLSKEELPERMQGMIERGDFNKDGFLTVDEIRRMADVQASGDPIERALDADRDGVISASEIEHAPAALKSLDKNGDGQLTPDEYRPQRL